MQYPFHISVPLVSTVANFSMFHSYAAGDGVVLVFVCVWRLVAVCVCVCAENNIVFDLKCKHNKRMAEVYADETVIIFMALSLHEYSVYCFDSKGD